MTEYNYSVIGIKDGEETILGADVDFKTAIELFVDNDGAYDEINIAEDYDLMYRAENLLVVSDCEMMLDELKDLFVRPDESKEQFVFLGNFIAPAPGFYAFMTYLVKLKKQKKENCLFVRGKNEHNLLEYIHKTENYIGELDEVSALVEAIEEDLSFPLYTLKERFPEFYEILDESLPYYENDQYIFVSGGLSLSEKNWKDSTPEELYTMTDEFFEGKNPTDKTIVFGTTPARCFNTADVIRPYLNDRENKIGINGECRDYGKLIGLLILKDDRYFISIRHKETRRIAYAY